MSDGTHSAVAQERRESSRAVDIGSDTGAFAQVFQSAVQDSPNEPAIVTQGETVTYLELARFAERVADSLVATKIDSQSIVVVEDASDGATNVATLVAVSQLGATFVPASRGDESFRLARRISGTHIVTPVATPTSPPGVRRTTPAEVEAKAEGNAPSLGEYVILTSGSTSRPKAVPISRSNVSSLVDTLIDRRPIPLGARMALTYQPTFDPYYYVLLQTWLSRGTLVMPVGREHLLASKFVSDNEITCWDSVPFLAAFARSAECLEPGSMPRMQHATFGGEPLTSGVVDAWRAAAPDCEIVNSYGPTEMTISCMDANVESLAPWPNEMTMPVGEPFSGVEAKLLPTEEGPDELWELCLRGQQRFSGYVDPSDDVGRFVDDGHVPVAAGETVRPDHWYRTGDLVRSTEEGLVVVGRTNSQVKVRGYRVDLAEVRHALLGCGFDDAWVDAVDDRIVAVVQGGRDVNPKVELDGLREYAVPHRVVRVDALPRTTNGKVNSSELRVLFAR